MEAWAAKLDQDMCLSTMRLCGIVFAAPVFIVPPVQNWALHSRDYPSNND